MLSEDLSGDQTTDFIQHALHDAGTDRAFVGLTVMSQRMLVGSDWDAYYADPAVNDFYLPLKLLDSVRLMRGVAKGPNWRQGEEKCIVKQLIRRFDHEGMARLRLLLPAFNAGVAAVQSMTAVREGIATLLERVGEPLALANERGRVLHQTVALQKLVDAKPMEPCSWLP